ncbi:Mur ligase family protein [Mechercharimyces sp. CAU 1602]|uniref:Mur ligase family protein n=1 Tax=Mechercharimyces sp. CAU 1602 TaxID=2973933 RepID=UPI0021625CCE|nr:Mur ligase family protein [Mechercharimyces sp. CAU 1602]MCS1351127.1 Mur ligase family protein [Mechercharimyces sp. CAU 1602]
MYQEGGSRTKTISLHACVNLIGGKLIRGNGKQWINACNFGDYRRLQRNQVYFYTKQTSWERQLAAIRQVQPIAVVLPYSLKDSSLPSKVALIVVKDAYRAFWTLGKWNWQQYNPTVIGITGSSGKSTTTAMLAGMLKQKFSMVKTTGNLNTFKFR